MLSDGTGLGRLRGLVSGLIPRSSRPMPLAGLPRTLADVAMSVGTVAAAIRARPSLGVSPRRLARFVRSQLVLAEGLRSNKYVLFDGKLFVDAFVPHWPSPAFDRMMGAYAANAGRPSDRREDFVAYVALAITRRCVFRCEHCYASHNLASTDVLSLEKLLQVVESLVQIGVGVLSLEGGEPLMRFDDLLVLLRAVAGRANPFVATTGMGLTPGKAAALKDAGLVGAQVSLDHFEREQHNRFRRSPKAFDAACGAVRMFREAGVFPIVAVCPSPEMVRSGGLRRHLDLARDLGAGMLQVLDPMPAGNYLEAGPGGPVLTPAQVEELIAFHAEANTDPRFRDHPAVSARAYMEEGCRYGCGLGGNQHFYVDAMGNVTPCVYLGLSAGNVLEEDFGTVFRRMRAMFPRPVGGFCPVYGLAPDIAARSRAGAALPLPPPDLAALAPAVARRGLPGLFRRIER